MRARQNPSGTSLGQTSKQLHAGAIKPEPGFCGSGFLIFSEHPFPVPCRLRGRDCRGKKIYIHSHALLPVQVCFSTSRRRDDETYLQDRLKQWISFSHALIGCSNSGYTVKFTSMRPQTRVSYEQNGFPVYCRNKRRNLTKKLKKLFPEKTRRRRRTMVCTGEDLSV